MNNIVAFEVEPGSHEARKPGAFYFIRQYNAEDIIGIVHGCPCGCGGLTALYFRGKGGGTHDEWDVKGEWPKVTLTPSIGVKYDGKGNGPTNFHWHGFLENGEFVER